METDETETPHRSRKSSRPRKRKQTYSPEPQPEEVQKKKKVRKTQPNRPYDILPNGQAFCCTLCNSPYVANLKGTKKAVKSRHTPLPKVRVDQNTGREIQLCTACAQSFDRPRHRTKKPEVVPTEEEQQAYLHEAKLFTKLMRAELDEPYVDRLFCPVSKKKLCGCLQRYIKSEMSVSGIACIQTFVNLMKEAEELRKEKVYDGQLAANKTKTKKSIGLGNGHKKSRRYEEFVMTKRRDLKEDMRLCERATQRVLMYSNNFLHKKLKTEERPCRIERTRGKAVLGKLPEIHTLVDMVCCSENCVMMALTHRKLLQSWRDRSKLGQMETRRVLAEMLTPAGANHRNCYHFIGYVTGCSPSTIGRVYSMMMESSGNREPMEHGMKKVWQDNYKQNKVIGNEREKSVNSEVEIPEKRPVVSESRTAQKTTKSTNQKVPSTTPETNVQIQYELQKQQLAMIQMDLLEKQQQLEQQQANLQLQLMAQQASTQSDNLQMNQMIIQQILQQLSQATQQFHNTTGSHDHGRPVTSQPELLVNQSDQTGSVAQTVPISDVPLQVLNMSCVNGEVQFSLTQSSDQGVITNPVTLNLGGSLQGHIQTGSRIGLEGDIINSNPLILDQQNSITIYGTHPSSETTEITNTPSQPSETYPVSRTNSFVNNDTGNYELGPTVNSLHQSVMTDTENQSPPIADDSGTSEQDSQMSDVYGAPVSNMADQGTISSTQTGSPDDPNYQIKQVQDPGEMSNNQPIQTVNDQTSSFQGHNVMTFNCIPVQVVDSNGLQYNFIGSVQNPTDGALMSQEQLPNQVNVVNWAMPVISVTNQNGEITETNFENTQDGLYNTIGNKTIESTGDANVINDTQQLSNQQEPNIQITLNNASQTQILQTQGETEDQPTQIQMNYFNTGNQSSESGSKQILSQTEVMTVPLYDQSDLTSTQNVVISNMTSNGKTPVTEKNQHHKRNVQFKNLQESSHSSLVLKDNDISLEDNLINPDMVLPRPHPPSHTRHSSGNSARSRQSSGNPSKSRHSSGNSLSNIDSFKQLSNSFKLKDLTRTNSVIGSRLRKSSGDRSRHASGDRLRHTSGDRSRQSSGNKSRQPSGDRSRQASGDRSRQLSGNSIFSEYSNLTTLSPNFFLNKDKSGFFLQTIDSITGSLEDIQSPDYAMFNSSPTTVVGASPSEMGLSVSETGRIEFDSNFIGTPLLSHESGQCEPEGSGLVKDDGIYDGTASINPVTSGIAMVTNGQKALKNPVLNSLLLRPIKHI